MLNATDSRAQLICSTLQWDRHDPSVRIEILVTLPHSLVARVQNSDGAPMLFKQAGSVEFAAGVRKELVVNRDVLSQFPSAVGPAFINGDETADRPWILFEDISSSHQAAAAQPPLRLQIEQFVESLARAHSQARSLPLASLFKNIEGDVYISDGAEHVPVVLDEFLTRVDSSRFPPGCFELVASIRDNVPRIAQLLQGDATLVHGDAHFANALYGAHSALLIDWALAVIGPGEVDLAHALAMNLPRLFSSEYEAELLRRYVATCGQHGVDIREAAVHERFRTCLLLTVIVAVGMNTVPGMSDQIWSFLFTNTVHSALDHDVMELLG